MERKTVLVIGDSVSIHYGPFLKEMIKSKYNFDRISEIVDGDLDKPVGANAGDSKMVLEYLKDEYNKGTTYNILLLNCGLHDIRIDRVTKQIQVMEWEYEENLNIISDLALKMSERVMWITTTPVLDAIHNRRNEGFIRYNKDVILYNSIAENIMGKYQISCVDIYTFTNNLGDDIYSDHVHFKESVQALQGAFIAGHLFCNR
ncbi:SGNH/GDSL hydrolase family protein [Desulfitobacterium sp. PCE1]|uniref:SGNH/GDSL hydrolase family protein n=1 Tax=Desulfitobacterium sp. PCE1 TaxID=146907 RepID=UPI0003683DDB|nr:SGNH/GDSL hydrolase family protein [Desulfitobacterium sp. PCE1]